MKLPEKIKGRNRIRDGKIMLLWDEWEGTTNSFAKTTAETFKITERRVRQIVKANHGFIQLDKEYEKKLRIKRLNYWLNKNPHSRKDPLEVQAELRKEIEGDKPLVDQSIHQTNIYKIEKVDLDDRVRQLGGTNGTLH